jgi:peptidoglycan/xylan/chitin deacetylase (PgdA/CDA1 family)
MGLVGSPEANGSGGRDTLILMYHRVAHPEADLWSLAVTPTHFADHVDALSALYDVVPLRRALEPAFGGKRVVITFDDGYADNLDAARLLADRGVPATFFLTVGQLGTGQEFWWDHLGRILLTTGKLPETIALEVGGEQLTLELGPDAILTREEAAQRSGWRAWQAPSTTREHAYVELYRRLRPLEHSERARVLVDLAERAGLARADRPRMRALTVEEVAELSALNGMEIGAHTMTHPQLALLSPDRQHEEILGSRRALEEIVGSQVETFAYPYGKRGVDYSAETIEVVAEAGFQLACASEGGALGPSEAHLDLSRWMVCDWEADVLTRQIEMAFAGSTQTPSRRPSWSGIKASLLRRASRAEG